MAPKLEMGGGGVKATKKITVFFAASFTYIFKINFFTNH